jgi:hypothetical protein
MSNKRMKVYKKTAKVLVYDFFDTWVRFEADGSTLVIDSCNISGEPQLTPAQVEDVIEGMQAAIRTKGKATKGKARRG